MKFRAKFEERTAANLQRLDVAKARLMLAQHRLIAVPARVTDADLSKLREQVRKYDDERMRLLQIGWGMKPQKIKGTYPT